MKLVRLITGDIRFQWKYGFYFIYCILCVLYICLLAAFPTAWKDNAAAIMVYSDPAAMGLFFMGAIVLLEKSQRVLNSLAVSPVRVAEYIMSKVFALMVISLLVALILAIASGAENLLRILFGTALTSAIFTLLGLMAATKISSLNQFMVVILPIEIICLVPPIISLFVTLPTFMRWYPFNICMAIISGEYQNLWVDIPSIVAVILILFVITYHMVSKMWKSVGGVKL